MTLSIAKLNKKLVYNTLLARLKPLTDALEATRRENRNGISNFALDLDPNKRSFNEVVIAREETERKLAEFLNTFENKDYEQLKVSLTEVRANNATLTTSIKDLEEINANLKTDLARSQEQVTQR